MGKAYFLMRKNEVVTFVQINKNGIMENFSSRINVDIAPLQDRYKPDWLKRWWQERSVPITRDHIQDFLQRQYEQKIDLCERFQHGKELGPH